MGPYGEYGNLLISLSIYDDRNNQWFQGLGRGACLTAPVNGKFYFMVKMRLYSVVGGIGHEGVGAI